MQRRCIECSIIVDWRLGSMRAWRCGGDAEEMHRRCTGDAQEMHRVAAWRCTGVHEQVLWVL